MSSVVQKLLQKSWEEPCFFVNFVNCGRGIHSTGLISDKTPTSENIILYTSQILGWKIANNKLEKCSSAESGIFYNEESYMIQWDFVIRDDDNIHQNLLYYWKGEFAIKGFSPLPEDIDQSAPVERIRQWSEPPVFFQIFLGKMVVFSGKSENLNLSKNHLFIIRGEIECELHLYEIPCKKENLRSRTTMLLVLPEKHVFIYWHGQQTLPQYKDHLLIKYQPHETLKKAVNTAWDNFSVVQLYEGKENTIFLENIEGNLSDYFFIKQPTNFTPRLFYLNSITGPFLGTEVEYSLRSKDNLAPFPFLQSHLYTASQPALFLIDNYSEVWLWKGWTIANSNSKKNDIDYVAAKQIIEEYVKEKEKILQDNVILKFVNAGSEPLEFTNIFPYWSKKLMQEK